MAIAADRGSAEIWDVGTGKRLKEWKAFKRGIIGSVAISPDGKLLAVANGQDKDIKLWDVAKEKEIGTLTGHEGAVICLAFAPDGKTLASGGYDKTVRIWNVDTMKDQAVLKGHTIGVRAIQYSPVGKLLVSVSNDHWGTKGLGETILWE